MYYLDREGLTFLINRIKQWISSFSKEDTPVNGSYVTSVSESNGVISVTRETADTVPTVNSTKMITSGGVKNALSTELTSVNGNPITITDASNTNCETLIATIAPIQSGTGDPSPTNVRPISGVNPLFVNRTGKNIAPFVDNVVSSASNLTVTTTSDGGIHISGTPSRTWADLTSSISAYIPSGTTITLSRSVSRNYSMFVTLTYTDASTSELTVYRGGKTFNTLTLSKDVSAIKLHLSFLSTSTNYDETIYPQLEFGSSVTTYEPYQGTTLSLSLGSTVYGGSVDLNTGVLTVDKAMVDLGDFTWYYIQADNVFYNAMPTTCDYNAGSTDTLCSGFAYDTDATWYNSLGENQYMMCKDLFYYNRVSIAVKNTSVSTAEDFKTLVTGMKFVYPLATPTTIQLTPQTIRLLQGNNTLWTNGESLEVQYQPNNFVGDIKSWTDNQFDNYAPTKDASGNTISSYIKDLSVSGTTITYTKGDATTGTITTQDTTYGVATTNTSGLMSQSDKVKLDGIATGAQVNQNAFSRILVGATTIEADSTTDTLGLIAGNNVTLTPDTTNDTVTITATGTAYSAGTGLSLSGSTINHSNSVTSGTIGTSSATSGYSISVPYANYDAQGHITSKGTHTHTVPTPQIVFNAFGSSSNVRTNSSSSYTNYNYMNTWSSVSDENTTYIDRTSSAYRTYIKKAGLYYVRANVTFTTTGQINRLKRAKITLNGNDKLIVTRRPELTSSSSSNSVWEDVTVEGFIQVTTNSATNNYLEVYALDESGSASWYVQGLQIVYIG